MKFSSWGQAVKRGSLTLDVNTTSLKNHMLDMTNIQVVEVNRAIPI